MANGISRILTHHVLEIYLLLSPCLSALILPLTILHLSSSVAIPAAPLAVPPVTAAPLQQATFRGVVKDVNSLKDKVKSLKMDILALNKSKQPSPSLDSCHICVICSNPHISKEAIPSLLMCPVLSISKVKSLQIENPKGLSLQGFILGTKRFSLSIYMDE